MVAQIDKTVEVNMAVGSKTVKLAYFDSATSFLGIYRNYKIKHKAVS